MKQISPLLAVLMMRAGISVAFNNAPGQPSWKMDGDKIALTNGNPTYVDSDGKEMTVDFQTISRLNGEAANHRKAKETAETSLKAFEGLDATKAREALELVGKLDQKKLIDAGEVDKVRATISGEFTKQLDEVKGTLTKKQERINALLLNQAFGGSDFIRDNIALPMDFVRSFFGQFFSVDENENIVAKDATGNQLFSTKRAGELASFDEAIEILVNRHPQKDTILKMNTGNGTGNQGNGNRTARTMRRADFDQLLPAQKAEAAQRMGKGELNIVD